jgi:hypothetical protein
MMVPGHLGVEGRGKAPHWRLTELGYMHEPPTRDFDRWNGKPFAEKKLKPRAGFLARGVAENPHTSVAENPHTSVAENPHTKNGKCGGKPAHKDGPRGVAENPHITSLTTSHLKKAGQLGTDTRNGKHGKMSRHRQRLDAASGGRS